MTKQIQKISFLVICSILFSTGLAGQCTANFTFTTGANNTYTFQGMAAPSNSTTTYSWNFGDGNIGNGIVVPHQYFSNGTYTVTLNIITSSPSCSASVSQTISVAPCPLNSNFVYTINPNALVNFQSTSTGTSSASLYTWDFGDGTMINGVTTTAHTYSNNGTYSAFLYIYDTLALCFDSVAYGITISSFPCNFSASFNTPANNNGQVNFNNTSSPLVPTPICSWNFGDGNTSTQFSPVHTYTATGNYTVLLSASQGTCISTFSSVVSVTVIPCNVNASFTYTLANNGQVNFTNTSTMPTNYYSTWNFGNNTSGAGNNPIAYYSANGTYSVFLLIHDSVGSNFCTDTITMPVTITNVTCSISNGLLNFNFNEDQNGAAQFYTNVTNSNVIYSWSFGNGNTSTAPTPTTTYSSAGIYTVMLTVTDATNSACNASVTNTIQIYYYPCTLNAAFTSTLTSNTLSVTCISTGTSSGINSLTWNWGDGSFSSGTMNSSASHTYPFNGTYTVTLMVADSIGSFLNYCFDTTSIVITINSGAPCPVNSNFSLQKDTTQLYSWFAYTNYQSNVVSATWNWGDGTSSNALFPSHTYSAVGWYNVCLTVSLSCGSQSTTCYNSYLNKTTNANAAVFIQVMNAPVGIKNNADIAAEVSIAPNPSNGEFLIQLHGTSATEPVEIFIYNTLGENVYQQTSGSEIIKIRLADLSNGCYIVSIKNRNTLLKKKLIINK